MCSRFCFLSLGLWSVSLFQESSREKPHFKWPEQGEKKVKNIKISQWNKDNTLGQKILLYAALKDRKQETDKWTGFLHERDFSGNNVTLIRHGDANMTESRAKHQQHGQAGWRGGAHKWSWGQRPHFHRIIFHTFISSNAALPEPLKKKKKQGDLRKWVP